MTEANVAHFLGWLTLKILADFERICEKNKVIDISDQSMFVEKKKKINITSMNGNVISIWGMVYTI